MRRLLTLLAVLAVMVAFTLPVSTASAASHGKKDMANPCAAKAKATEAANPCAAKAKATEAANPCAAKKVMNPCAKKEGMMDKDKDMAKPATK